MEGDANNTVVLAGEMRAGCRMQTVVISALYNSVAM